ncbi:hypothetical protein [Actinokineospora globicatena]|uniref:hypothetical protein n=1 Tax=Actinokineospora globicatena TaxID=103729 RepID=UPI0020A2AA52|nr:hypothetical protein [Actinokineospora globicatena]
MEFSASALPVWPENEVETLIALVRDLLGEPVEHSGVPVGERAVRVRAHGRRGQQLSLGQTDQHGRHRCRALRAPGPF